MRANPYRRPSYRRLLAEIRRLTGASYREAQLVWQRLGPWLDLHDRANLAGIRRHPKKLGEFLALARNLVPAGYPVEITLTTQGGTYRRLEGGKMKTRTDLRPLEVKVTLVARRDLSLAEHERALRHVTEMGVVHPDFKLVGVVDWKKGEGRKANRGTIRRQIAGELVNFYGAAHYPKTRIRSAMRKPRP